MSNAAKKLPELEVASPLESTTEREVKLANNFEDPGIDALIIDLGQPADPVALLNETADAVQELLLGEEKVNPLDLLETSDSSVMMDASALESVQVNARWDMAEKLFALVSCELPFEDLVDSILRAIVTGVGAEAGSILEVDNEKSEFFFRAIVGGGNPDQLKSFRVPYFKGIVGHVAESRQPVLLQDLASDEMQLKAISASTGFETHTCIAAPIVVANQLYGVIELFNKQKGGSFTQRDVTELEDTIRMAEKILEVRFLMAELARRAK